MLHECLDDVGTDIGSHDQDGVLEIDRAAFVVGQAAVVKHLKQDIEHIRMSLLDLVEKHHRVRLASYRFCKLTAFIVSHIARRRSHEAAYRMTLLIFAHIDACHHVLIIEEELRKGFGKLCLTDTGSSHEKERADRPLLILKACS